MMSSVLHLIQLVSDDNDDSHIYVIPLYGPSELEIKDTTDTDKSASYLDLFLEITTDGRLHAKIYDKRDDFNFPIVNFPFPSSYKNNQLICTILITITRLYSK